MDLGLEGRNRVRRDGILKVNPGLFVGQRHDRNNKQWGARHGKALGRDEQEGKRNLLAASTLNQRKSISAASIQQQAMENQNEETKKLPLYMYSSGPIRKVKHRIKSQGGSPLKAAPLRENLEGSNAGIMQGINRYV